MSHAFHTPPIPAEPPATSDALAAENARLERRLDDEMMQAAQLRETDRIALNQAQLDLDRANEQIKTLRSDLNAALESLDTALREAGAPTCETCDGHGTVKCERDGYGGPADETPPQVIDVDGCEDCQGLGREWL